MAEIYYDSPRTGEELDAAFSKLATIDQSVQQAEQSAADAKTQAKAAASSAAAAQQAAQEALGFRTFFSAIAPDANGGLDPSRPMTTPSAQPSWTIESKGDRIQSVQVNGFTQSGQSSGLNKKTTVPTSGWSFVNGIFFSNVLESATGGTSAFSNIGKSLGTKVGTTTKFALLASEYEYAVGFHVVEGDINSGRMYIKAPFDSTADLQKWLSNNDFWVIYNSSAPDSLFYIPIETKGHEYRCQCLPLTEALASGDTVQSNVPSGCDKKIVFDSTNVQNWESDVTDDPQKYRYKTKLQNPLGASSSPQNSKNAYTNFFRAVRDGRTFYQDKGFTINASDGYLYIYDEGESLSEWKEKFLSEGFVLVLYYKSTSYTSQYDVLAELETHASGNVYAHPAVDLVAVPYTQADVDAANQLANTPSTLDTETQAAAFPVVGTYVVSSQEGTTVQVSLKAMQDGGDAATLGGLTLDDIKELISNAVTAAVRMAQAQGGNS